MPRPWAPWPLTLLSRWKKYGRLLETDFEVEEVFMSRPPGAWFLQYESRAMSRAMTRKANELHRINKFDAIWAAPVLPDAVAATAIKKTLDLPLIALAIGSDVMVRSKDPSLKKQIQHAIAEADLCLGVSNAICDKLSELGATDPFCVYLGRDNSMFHPTDKVALRNELKLPNNAIVAVYVGLVVKTKGIAELATATTELLERSERFHLVCVGSGPAQDLLEQIGNERIHMVGEQPPENVPKYLQAADFFVFPSHSEGMPQSVLEAMHCALPIVATDVGGTPEAVTHRDNGLLVPPHSPEQLLDAMQTMISDEMFRKQAGDRSVAIVGEKFDSRSNAEKLAQRIYRVVNEVGRR